MFNIIDIYHFIPASGFVGMGPSARFSPGAYYAVKTEFVIDLPGNIVDPPDRTMLLYKSLLISMSDINIELWIISWIPTDSIPIKNNTHFDSEV